MADFCEIASALEEQQRAEALAAQQLRSQRIADSFKPALTPAERECEDCGQKIDPARLKAYSVASRCTECATIWEAKNSHFARRT